MNDLEMQAHFVALEWLKHHITVAGPSVQTPESFAVTYQSAYDRILKELSRRPNTTGSPYSTRR